MKYVRIENEYTPSEHYGEQVLKNRGIKELDKYLMPSEDALIPAIYLDNIIEASTTIVQHVINKSEIFILPDADQDGYTSAAIIWNYIKKLDKNAKLSYSMHSGKTHGITKEFLDPKYDLYIIPDAGSSQFEMHKYIKEEYNAEIVVIDHHQAEKYSEHAIVVNNQLSENYPNKDLSGAGMVLKVCQTMDALTNNNYADEFYDLAAIGIVGDMMSLKHLETRYIVSRGLNDVRNPFMRTVLEKEKFLIGDSLNPTKVSFNVAPLVNAVTRVGTMEDKTMVFEGFINGTKPVKSGKRGAKEDDYVLCAEEAVRLARNARSRQNSEKTKVVEHILKRIETENLDEHAIIFVTEDIENPAMTGVIANELTSIFKKPVLVTRDKDGTISGSGRNVDREEIPSFKDFLNEVGLTNFAEGHDNAFGMSIEETNIENLLKEANEAFKDVNFNSSTYEVDFVLDGGNHELHRYIYETSEMKNLWGRGVEEPTYAIENINLLSNEIEIIGRYKNTIRFIHNGVSYIKFRAKDEIPNFQKYDSMRLTVVGKSDVNEWQGRFTPQIVIEDYTIEDTSFEF